MGKVTLLHPKEEAEGPVCFLTSLTLGWENFLTAGGFSNLLAASFELKIHPTIRARFLRA